MEVVPRHLEHESTGSFIVQLQIWYPALFSGTSLSVIAEHPSGMRAPHPLNSLVIRAAIVSPKAYLGARVG